VIMAKTLIKGNGPTGHNEKVSAMVHLREVRKAARADGFWKFKKTQQALKKAGKLVTKNSPSALYFA